MPSKRRSPRMMVDELDRDLTAVEVVVEVEQKHLEHRRAVVEGRPRAEVGRAGWVLAVDHTRTA